MSRLDEAVQEFLALRRIAVAGVSRSGKDVANVIYRKLRGAGYEVFAVNPNAERVEGDVCYPDLGAIPGGAEGVVIATRPSITDRIVRECVETGVSWVWMHRSIGKGSVSADAAKFCREHGVRVIDGSCPMMFCPPVDFPHRCMRLVLRLTGGLPRGV